MDLIFKQNITDTIIPPIDDKDLWEFLSKVDIKDYFNIKIDPKPLCKINDCHNNVIRYVEKYGGKRVIGLYILKDINDKNYVGITHSIWDSPKYGLIDITPTTHKYGYNLFCVFNENKLSYKRVEYYDGVIFYDFN
jgi:hypothetical protein